MWRISQRQKKAAEGRRPSVANKEQFLLASKDYDRLRVEALWCISQRRDAFIGWLIVS
jgi:hypothetical protein